MPFGLGLPYTYINAQNLHDAGKMYIKNSQNRDLANLVILDQLKNQEYHAKVRYYTANGANKFGLNFYVPPAFPVNNVFVCDKNTPVNNDVIVSDGKTAASNKGVLVPGILPVMPVANPVAMTVANPVAMTVANPVAMSVPISATMPVANQFANRYIVAPYYSGVQYNYPPVVSIKNNYALPQFIKRT